MSTATISIDNLSYQYKKNTKKILDNINIEVKQGEIFGLLGPSGAGKTTMIRLMTGQIACLQKSIYINGSDIALDKRSIYKDMGVMMDSSGLYERLTCYANLQLFANIHHVHNNFIMDILEKVGLKDDCNKEVYKLSKGMRQRLALARAVIHSPAVVFLDEPTNGLDPVTADSIHNLISELKKEGASIFLTTHNMQEATKLCDQIGILYQGKLIESDTPNRIRNKYWHNSDVKIVYQNGEESVLSLKEDHVRFKEILDDGEITSIHSLEPTLEDVFIAIAKQGGVKNEFV